MEIILLALLGLMVLVALVSFFMNKKSKRETEIPVAEIDPNCCGAHEVCESDLELTHVSANIYYQDEELDRFANINPQDFGDEEIDEFREVLYTLKRNEISSWLSCLEFRKISAPGIIRDEAMLLLQD